MIELWKPIPGFPNYAASTMGRIKRIIPSILPNGGYAPMNILKPQNHYKGYHEVLISNWPVIKRRCAKVHRLILLTFIGLPEVGLQVNHKNGIKTDNRLSNLEWVTPASNLRHAYRNGLRIPLSGNNHWTHKYPYRVLRGEAKENSKLNERIVRIILSGDYKKRGSQAKMVRTLGINRATFYSVFSRKTWKHVMKEQVG